MHLKVQENILNNFSIPLIDQTPLSKLPLILALAIPAFQAIPKNHWIPTGTPDKNGLQAVDL